MGLEKGCLRLKKLLGRILLWDGLRSLRPTGNQSSKGSTGYDQITLKFDGRDGQELLVLDYSQESLPGGWQRLTLTTQISPPPCSQSWYVVISPSDGSGQGQETDTFSSEK
jgi:hypothetical protein